MFDDLTGPLKFVAAFAFVLLLIGIAAWLVRRFGATRVDAAARGRQPRLAVIDSAAVDGRRKLVIIRRDNVEHLLMIGGPSDVVVETNIVRGAAVATRDAPPARNGAPETMARAMPMPEPTPWPLQPETAPAPPPMVHQPVRAQRTPSDDAWQTPPAEPVVAPPPVPEVRPVRPADTLAGLAEELARPSEPIAARPVQIQPAQMQPAHAQPPQVQPARVAAPQPAATAATAQPSQAADQSLAEMAQRLEAALRRPMAQKVVAETARVTATVEVKAGTPKAAVQPRSAPPRLPQGNLEQEMASLLSRPGKP
jgi:flagellar protein FliO/FliZ